MALRPRQSSSHLALLTKCLIPGFDGTIFSVEWKDATVKRNHYDDHAQLRRHLADFIDAYNFGWRLRLAAQNPQRPHAIRIHLQMLDFRA